MGYKYSKFGAKRVHEDEYGTFDSIKEYNRFKELKIMENNGEISDLQRQVIYTLIPRQELSNGGHELPVRYVADFVYNTPDGEQIVEDTKGYRTDEYVTR